MNDHTHSIFRTPGGVKLQRVSRKLQNIKSEKEKMEEGTRVLYLIEWVWSRCHGYTLPIRM